MRVVGEATPRVQRQRTHFATVRRWRQRSPLGLAVSLAVVAGIVGAPTPAAAEPSTAAAEEAASEQAPRLGDLTDTSTPPEVGRMADLSDPLPDDELGAALDEAEATGQPVELASQTTESVISYAMPDGTVKVESAAGPVRTQVDGDWVDVDTTLQLTPNGVQPVAVTGDITFSAGGTAPMAVLGDGDGQSVSLQWPGELPAPELDGDTATYRDVLPDVDLVLTATRLGFEQHVVVNAVPDAATLAELSSLEFPLASDGATVQAGDADQLTVVDDDSGEAVGRAVPPLMWDARTDPHTDQPVAVEEIGLDLAPASVPGTDSTLVLTPPTEFLTDPATVYPVVIDPTQTLGAIGDTFVQSGIANSPQGSSTELRAGSYNGGGDVARGLLRFDVSALKNRVVQSANLALWEFHSFSCTARWVDVHESGDFDPNTATWNNQPWIGKIVANANVALGYSSACPANWVNFNMTGHAQYFADSRNNYPNIMAVAVTAGSETDNLAWKKFNSGNAANGVPVLTFTYDGGCDQYAGLRICGAIRDKYYSVGGPGGFLGMPTVGDTAINGGYYSGFAGGSIHWSAATGAHITRGAIRDRWGALGWENGVLGYPSDDEVCGQAAGGCYQFFAGGTMFWTAATGAHAVVGAIRDKYAALGWHNSSLGYPTTDEVAVTGGRASHFSGGSIYWSSGTGAHNVQGAILAKWDALGRETSSLGLPITDQTCGLTGGGCYNHFSGGSIYWSSATGAHTIRGWIRDKWAALGWETSSLGYPTTDETAIAGGQFNDFTGGSIYSSVDGGAHPVSGERLQRWQDLDSTAGYLGFPTSDAFSSAVGATQLFTGGGIVTEAGSSLPQDCSIIGTNAADQLTGTSGRDIICAFAGDDTIYGLEGDDVIFGGDGADQIDGGPDADYIYGGLGNDQIIGGDGSDVLYGNDGSDTVAGGAGDDEILGDLGDDNLRGDDGDDTLASGDGQDVLSGGEGSDVLSGDTGADALTGEAGDDLLEGGDGADTLSGQDGNDRLIGNAGDDQLLGGAGDDTARGGGGVDGVQGGSGSDDLDGGLASDDVDGGPDVDACVAGTAQASTIDCETVHVASVADAQAAYLTSLSPVDLGVRFPQSTSTGWSAIGDGVSVLMPSDSQGLLQVAATGEEATPYLTVDFPDAGPVASPAVVAQDGTVVYGGPDKSFTVLAQATDTADFRLATVINSAVAGTRFQYSIASGPGGYLRLEADGSVTALDASGGAAGEFAPPWAQDANGQTVPTHYEVAGQTLTQVVDLSGAGLAYPVTADPASWSIGCHGSYGKRHPSDETRLVYRFNRPRTKVTNRSNQYVSAGPANLRCGWELYGYQTNDGEDHGSGYRHLFDEHQRDWGAKASFDLCCNWIDAADGSIKAVFVHPDVLTIRSNGLYCYSSELRLINRRNGAVVQRFFAVIIFAPSDSHIVTAYPSGRQCTA